MARPCSCPPVRRTPYRTSRRPGVPLRTRPQRSASLRPHSKQNLASPGFSCRHWGQRITATRSREARRFGGEPPGSSGAPSSASRPIGASVLVPAWNTRASTRPRTPAPSLRATAHAPRAHRHDQHPVHAFTRPGRRPHQHPPRPRAPSPRARFSRPSRLSPAPRPPLEPQAQLWPSHSITWSARSGATAGSSGRAPWRP